MRAMLRNFLQDAVERDVEDLRKLRKNAELAARVVGDLSFKNKASWPGFVDRLLGAILDEGVHDNVVSFMNSRDVYMASEDIPIEAQHFENVAELPIVFQNSSVRALQSRTESGETFFVVQYDNNREWDLYTHEEQALEPIFAHLSSRLWRRRKALRMDWQKTDSYSGHISLSTLELGDYRYVGALESRIEEWRRFKDANIRRSVLLQGKPGCGKSTLCLHAASELSERTVVVSSKVFEELSGNEWQDLMCILNPEMLILDDIDRVGNTMLGNKLGMIEERGCEIPFLMFTSNHLSEIPEAFRRPGRIDQILIVDEPEPEVRRRMVERFAHELGVEVPDEEMDRLQSMILSHSGAHTVEALKRGKVLGWKHSTGQEDVTFTLEHKEAAE